MNQDHCPTPRVNWVAVIATLAVLFGWLAYSSYRWPSRPAPQQPPAATDQATAPSLTPAPTPTPKAAPSTPRPPEEHALLENDNVRVLFTSYGGGIGGIELKQHATAQGTQPIILNTVGPLPGPDATPALPIFARVSGNEEEAPFTQKADASRVVYTQSVADGVQLERTYTLTPGKGYTLKLEERFVNGGKLPVTLPATALQIGTAGPLYPNDQPTYVGSDWLTATDKFHRETASEFPASKGFLGINGHPARDLIAPPAAQGPLQWVAVKNRFFVLSVQPDDPTAFDGLILRPADMGKSGSVLPAMQTAAKLTPLTLAPGETKLRSYVLYAGPKDHRQLQALGRDEQAIMEYGWWGFMAIPLAAAMEWMHRYVPNYGWTIVLLTLALKAILWKFQSAANHSMKKMQALQPKQKELADRYKEDPQRMQVETMKLYQEYGVNPLGGCLPMLIQIPIFLGFYTMLQSAGQFQHQSWLWVKDLVQPDTVAVIPGLGLPINPLPILMAFTQWIVMRLTPQPNAAAAPQMKIMQWMPVVMMFVLYNFAAALALYWTTNNLVSIVQTYRNIKKPVPVLTRVKKKKTAVPAWLKPKKQ